MAIGGGPTVPEPRPVPSGHGLAFRGPNAGFFADAFQEGESLLGPTLSLFEVFEYVLGHLETEEAVPLAAAMRQGTPVDRDSPLALEEDAGCVS